MRSKERRAQRAHAAPMVYDWSELDRMKRADVAAAKAFIAARAALALPLGRKDQ